MNRTLGRKLVRAPTTTRSSVGYITAAVAADSCTASSADSQRHNTSGCSYFHCHRSTHCCPISEIAPANRTIQPAYRRPTVSRVHRPKIVRRFDRRLELTDQCQLNTKSVTREREEPRHVSGSIAVLRRGAHQGLRVYIGCNVVAMRPNARR